MPESAHDEAPETGDEPPAPGEPQERIVPADNRMRLLALGVFVAATATGLLGMRWITERIAALERLVPVDAQQALKGTIALLWWLTGLAAAMALIVAMIVVQKSRAIRRANR